MSGEEMVVIISALGFTSFMFSQIVKLIRFGIEKKSAPQEARDMQLREEFVKFRRQTEQRLSTLEVSERSAPELSTPASQPRIALPEQAPDDINDRLPNMLKQKA